MTNENGLKGKSVLQHVVEYVSNPSSNAISFIDAGNTHNLKNVKVGFHPFGITVDPTTHKIYVANVGSNTISVIDGYTDKLIGHITEKDRNPSIIVVNPTTHKIFVANNGSNTISVIDGYTDKVIKSIPVEKNPSAIFVNKQTNHVYVTNKDSNTVSVINGAKTYSVIDTISVGKAPMDLVADYDQQKNINKIYVANRNSETISVIDGKTDKVINTIPLGNVRPVSITLDPESHNLFLNTLDFSYGGTEYEINSATTVCYPIQNTYK